jgi:GT2 family glycosyltransferase
VDHIFETLMDPGTVVGAFRFKTDLNSRMMKSIEYIVNLRAQYFNLPYGDQGLFIRKNVFESIGGFPDVPLAEDLFLVRRLSKRGRIRIAPAEAITSARRWQRVGLLRNSLINIVVAMGCYLGIAPHVLLSLQRFQHRK